MKLNRQADFSRFFSTVRQCRGKVLFTTREGDRLDLKSSFSQFIFVGAALSKSTAMGGEIICEEPGDYELLREYLLEA